MTFFQEQKLRLPVRLVDWHSETENETDHRAIYQYS